MKNILLIIVLGYCSCKSGTKPEVTVEGKQYESEKKNPVEQKDTVQPGQAFNNMDLEVFGDLRIGQHYTELISKMGEPAIRSKAVQWEADGLMHEDWDYQAKGIMINLASEPNNKEISRKIFSITAKAPCVFKTTRNIGIGSSYPEVQQAYKGLIDESTSDATLITVGSVYGGILFSFKNDKVETIFFGAAAE
jgi:hypothetical protein